jgi:Flp pilus assembly protein TadD
MTLDKIKELHSRVNSELDASHFGKAISTVKAMLKETGLNRQVDNVERIGETFRYMLHYLLEGVPDEGRDRLLSEISEQLRGYADLALRAALAFDCPDYYYSLLRFNTLRDEHVSDILREYGEISSEMSLAELGGNDVTDLRKRRESQLTRLFNALFTSLGADADYADLTRYLNSGYADTNVAAQALSAMTLAQLCFYDKAKLTAMLDIYDNAENPELAARALVGIVLSMIDNKARIEADTALMSRLSLWNDSIETYRRLQEVIKVIIGTRDTERVAAKMKDEVIPELMKLRPDIMKTLREGSTELDAAMLENNPEWEEILSKSDLTKKMQELSEMQSDGADLMMVTFSNLKQFPFFNTAANWFLPFDSERSELNLSPEMKRMVEMLHNIGGVICDSDMYSLALAAERMPEAQKNMMTGQLSAQFENMSEEAKSTLTKSSEPAFDTAALKTVRDLYRFFKLFRKREGFNDPFARPLKFLDLPVVGTMMSEEEVLRLVGEFYFKRGYYADALPMLEALAAENADDATLWEKIGFCHQSAGRFAQAREAYSKAALLKTPGPWLTNKLAYVNRRLGNYAEAAEYYTNALEMDPDNVSLIMNAGNMLLETGDVAGALSHFYHANYLRSDNQKVMRAVAWVELLNGNFAKSADYYSRIIALGAQASDYLNAGHAALLQGHFKEAVNFYRLSAEGNEADFDLAFNADLATLESLGANRRTAQLIADAAAGPVS